MQAWVVSDSGPGDSQPGPSAPAPATIYDHSAQVHTQSQQQYQSQSQATASAQAPAPAPAQAQQTRHVNILQTKPTTIRKTSRDRSRSPIVIPDSQRVATATAARIPMPSRSTRTRTHTNNTHGGVVDTENGRTISLLPQSQSGKLLPFWEGSTIEGSAFSDTASHIDLSGPSGHQLPFQGHHTRSHQAEENPRRRPTPRRPNRTIEPPPFVIGSDGLIDNGMEDDHEDGFTRNTSTPEAGTPRATFVDAASDSGRDASADESQYETSPTKTPSGKKLQHSKTMTLRPNGREPYSERFNYPSGDLAPRPQTLESHTYPSRNPDPVKIPHIQLERAPRAQVPGHQPRRLSVLPSASVPVISRQDELEDPVVQNEPLPMLVTKPVAKTKPQVNRQLFTRLGKVKVDTDEDIIVRSSPERRQPTTKKRSLALDYDDGALASMEYATLRSEEFDFDPAQAEARSVIEPPHGTLHDKLEHFIGKSEVDQTDFFTKMPVRDWEDSGDWFLEKFGDIISQFKEARQEKRDVVSAFEKEIADREQAVRHKVHAIGQTLAELKTEGEGMMFGKELR